MATKQQVLKLLDKGFNPQKIAKLLGCSDGYVRAVRCRAADPDYGKKFPSYQRSNEKHKRRYREDPKFRAACLKRDKDRYHAKKLSPARDQSSGA